MEISINLDDFGDCYLLNKLGLPQNGRGVLEIQENMDTWFWAWPQTNKKSNTQHSNIWSMVFWHYTHGLLFWSILICTFWLPPHLTIPSSLIPGYPQSVVWFHFSALRGSRRVVEQLASHKKVSVPKKQGLAMFVFGSYQKYDMNVETLNYEKQRPTAAVEETSKFVCQHFDPVMMSLWLWRVGFQLMGPQSLMIGSIFSGMNFSFVEWIDWCSFDLTPQNLLIWFWQVGIQINGENQVIYFIES